MYLPTPPPSAACDTRSVFKWSKAGLNSEFSFLIGCVTKAKEPSLSDYLPIAGGGRIDGFMPIPRVLVWSEIQAVLSRKWIQVTSIISYDDNHYSKFSLESKVCLVSKIPTSPLHQRLCARWPEGSLFNSYYTEVLGRALLLSQD